MSDISALSFGPTVGMLTDAMTGAGMEQTALADNIANVNTPDYKTQSVSFKDALAAAAGEPQQDGDLVLSTNNVRQFGGTPQPGTFDPAVQVDNSTQMRQDGSNVDIDQQMAQLSQNADYQQMMTHLLQVQFMRLRLAITEQPH